MIDKAINKFATDVTDDNVVNSYKELIDWVAKHGPEATQMAGGISENKTAIADLKTLVGTLPEGATSTTVVAYITEAINALSIGDYAKTTEVTAAISTALESYYTKTQVDEDGHRDGYRRGSRRHADRSLRRSGYRLIQHMRAGDGASCPPFHLLKGR